MMNKQILSGSGLIIALILFLAINIISNASLQALRLDFTQGKLYTLSTGTINILNKLDEPITLRLYLSTKLVSQLPGVNSYTVRVRELLQEYERLAGGNLRLSIIDPEPFTEEEDRAVEYGMQGVPLGNGSTFYFGLAGTNSTDGEETIAFFQPSHAQTLEYDISKLIHQLANPKQKTIGILSQLPIEGKPSMPYLTQGGVQPWVIVEQIRQLFTIRTLATNVISIPEEIDVLMLVHPKQLAKTTLYAIDQFVLKGGRLLAFVDPYSESDDSGNPQGGFPGQMPTSRSSDLSPLFKTWGIEMATNKVVGDRTIAKRVRTNKDSRQRVFDYPVWMDIPPTQMTTDDVVTGDIENITMATPGALQAIAGATTTMTPLIQTTASAALFDTAKFGFMIDPEDLLRKYTPENKELVLVARISGKVKSAYPDGAPKPDPKDKADTSTPTQENNDKTPHVNESVETINIIVVADTDLLKDDFWVQTQDFLGQRLAMASAANGKFVINALDNLSGSNDLILVRSRGNYQRPFTRVSAIRQQAEIQFRQKEQQLLARLSATEQKLLALQEQKKTGNSMLIVSAEQQLEIDQFRKEKIGIRKDLRNVQHELNKNIEHLEGWVKFLNIGCIPLLIVIGSLFMGLQGAQRKKSSKKNK